jgi:hypothetical protein
MEKKSRSVRTNLWVPSALDAVITAYAAESGQTKSAVMVAQLGFGQAYWQRLVKSMRATRLQGAVVRPSKSLKGGES